MLSLFHEIKRKSYYLSKATLFKHHRDGGLMEKAQKPVNAEQHILIYDTGSSTGKLIILFCHVFNRMFPLF